MRWGFWIPHDVFHPVRRGTIEGVEVNVPNDLTGYVRHHYGVDYLEPPPPERRFGHFESAFAWPEPDDLPPRNLDRA